MKVDVSERIRKATDTLADTAKTVKEEIGKAWDEMSAEDRPVANDPEGSPVGEQKSVVEEPAAENIKEIVGDLKKQEKPDVPTIQVNPEDKA